jgi:predicted DsbA family dithiol-disulfide isomerase
MKTVRFYHSMICPRCHLSGLILSQIREDFPDVAVEKVEYFTNLGRARRDGVRGIPTLVAGERRLAGIFLTPKSIRRFLEGL